MTNRRPFHTYRAWRRNAAFGRKPTGNTKPIDRLIIRVGYAEAKKREQEKAK